MEINAVHSTITTEAVDQAIRSSYPIQSRLGNLACTKVYKVWYPWYYCITSVKVETYFKKNIRYREVIAVDGRRRVRERKQALPEITTSFCMDGLMLEPKMPEEQASKEAIELTKGRLLNGRKLLKDWLITIKESRLLYSQAYILQIGHPEPGQWVYMDPLYHGAYPLSLRPEILEPFLEQGNA
ncbi:MAG: hypothetical protein WD266_00680 [Balneolales bacterium]